MIISASRSLINYKLSSLLVLVFTSSTTSWTSFRFFGRVGGFFRLSRYTTFATFFRSADCKVCSSIVCSSVRIICAGRLVISPDLFMDHMRRTWASFFCHFDWIHKCVDFLFWALLFHPCQLWWTFYRISLCINKRYRPTLECCFFFFFFFLSFFFFFIFFFFIFFFQVRNRIR